MHWPEDRRSACSSTVRALAAIYLDPQPMRAIAPGAPASRPSSITRKEWTDSRSNDRQQETSNSTANGPSRLAKESSPEVGRRCMRLQQDLPTDKKDRALQQSQDEESYSGAKETLFVHDSSVVTTIPNPGFTTTDPNTSSKIRARRAQSKSPSSFNQHFQQGQQPTLPQGTGETTALTSSNQPMYQATASDTYENSSNSNHNLLEGGPTTDYTEITYHASSSGRGGSQHGDLEDSSTHRGNLNSRSSLSTRSSHIPIRRQGTANLVRESHSQEDDLSQSEANPPLLEIPEEIYAVRKAALQVLKPLTRTWVRSVEVTLVGWTVLLMLLTPSF